MAILELQDIWRIYGRADTEVVKALEGINLSFERGEFVSIQGPSGCGKSTLLNILSGMETPSRGQILIDNQSSKSFLKEQWDAYRKNNLGFVFQHFNLIDTLTAIENVALVMSLSGIPYRERMARAKELLTLVGLSNRMQNTPLELSGGQKQRVAIARALANDPDIILADEPTGSLDSVTAHEIMELLKQVGSQKLVILVTHNEELARMYGTRLIRMKDGKVLSDESLQTVGYSEKKKLNDKNTPMPLSEALRLSFRSMKSRWGRILTTAIAGSIGIAGVAITLGLGIGVNNFVDEQSNMLLDSNRFDLMYFEETASDWDPNYSFYQPTIIPINQLEALVAKHEGVSWAYNINSFFNTLSQDLMIEGENGEDPINLTTPFTTAISDSVTLKNYLKYLVEGSRLPALGSRTEVVVNNLFIHAMASLQGLEREDYELKDYLNQTFYVDVPYNTYLGYENFDSINIKETFTIVGISEEMELFGTPRLFLSYTPWENYLKSIELPQLSASIDESVSLFDYTVHPCQYRFAEESYCNDSIELIVADTSKITATFEALQKDSLMYRLDENFNPMGPGFTVESAGNYIRMGLSTLLALAQSVLLVFVFVALGVSAILIAIVLFASALERKLEIGILKAVGARDKDVRRVFLAEALLIGSYAGFVGIGLGFFVQYLLYLWSPQLLNIRGQFNIVQIPLVGWRYGTVEWYDQIPLLAPLGLIILAVLVAILAGLIPSKRATAMRVVEALREE